MTTNNRENRKPRKDSIEPSRGTQKRWMFTFDSMQQVEDYLNPTHWNKNNPSSDWVGRGGLKNYEDYCRATKNPWEEGIATMNRFINRLKNVEIPRLKDRQRRCKFNEFEGDEIDYDRLYSGQSFFRKAERETVAGPSSVTIVIDTTTESFRRSQDILWRGASAVALATILEAKGIRTEIWVVNGSQLYRENNDAVMTACCLKRTSDTLDTSTLVNTISGWCYRSCVFAMLRTIAYDNGFNPKPSLGHIEPPTLRDLEKVTPDQAVIYSSGVFNFDAACKLMEHELGKIAEMLA
jgi:hypothetical protein